MIFFHADGSPTPHPTSRPYAVELSHKRYDDGALCSDCGQCRIKYTHNARCVHCARMAAIALYNFAVAGQSPDLLPPDDLHDECEPHLGAPAQYARTPDEARRAGHEVYLQVDPCEKAGHPGARLIDGRCWHCAREVSPRQAALNAGESWYTPRTPCPTCGTCAERRVENGRCSGCHPRRAHPADELPADLIISRADARTAGLTVYRTGRPCKRGHAGFRYVASGNCVNCIRGG